MAKIILFDGTDTSMWTKRDGSPIDWIVEDGCMTVHHGDIVSKVKYGDAHIHVEWREPDMPEASGQWKGNSGVYIRAATSCRCWIPTASRSPVLMTAAPSIPYIRP